MKARLYTLLKIESDYGLRLNERILWKLVEGVEYKEYVRNLIELRDAGHIKEYNDGNALTYRTRFLTEKGRLYLKRLKMLYLKELSLNGLKWTLKNWYVALLSVLAMKCCS